MKREHLGGFVAKLRRTSVARLALAGLCFIVYAAAVLTLHQENIAPFAVEEDGPLPAAVSHWVYGSPLGMVDTGLLRFFLSHPNTEEGIARAARGDVPLTGELSVTTDGSGIGGIAATYLSFVLFGPHARSLPLFFLTLLGLSTACFALRYRDERLSAVPSLLLALTLLLLTPNGQQADAMGQAPIGGVRYYAVLGLLPASHWFFWFLDKAPLSRAARLLDGPVLIAQAAILGFSILVRGAPIYLLISVVIAAAWAWRQDATKHGLIRISRGVCVLATVLAIGLLLLPRLAFPEYEASGRLFQGSWHRVLIGITASPEWPFPGIMDKYTCPSITGGMSPVAHEQIADCIWEDYALKHGYTLRQMIDKVLDGDYQRTARNETLAWIADYPSQIMRLVFYYKPANTIRVTVQTLQPVWGDSAAAVIPLVLLQLALVIAFITVRPPTAPLRDAVLRFSIICAFLVPALLPQLAVYTNAQTGLDLFTYVLCICSIGLWLAVAYVCRAIPLLRRHLPETAWKTTV